MGNIKFNKTLDHYRDGDQARILTAECSNLTKGGLFVSLEADAGPRYISAHLPRENVEEFRDFLTAWLDETEVRLPTAIGSRVVDHSPYGDRTYVLLPTRVTYRTAYTVGTAHDETWTMVDGSGAPGWETEPTLAEHVRSGRAEVTHDAGA